MIACDKCGKAREAKATKKGVRLPQSWKRHDGQVWCDACWRESFCLRAVTFPVVGPVDRDWIDLRAALAAAWVDSTRLANWMIRELYARDVRREPGAFKMPKRPRTYLYPETSAVAAEVGSQSRAAMEQAITGKYAKIRYQLIWTGEMQLPTFRYPYPYPVPNQAWSAVWLTDDKGGNRRPAVSLPLAGERWTLQLRGGHEFRRQLAAFSKIASGEAAQGELSIYRIRANGSDHRNGAGERDGGGQRTQTRVMVKLVAWMPKQIERDLEGVLFLTSSPDAMLSAVDMVNNHLFAIHADHVRRWAMEHRANLSRWSDDAKMETRHGSSFGSRRGRTVLKFNNRMDSACHELSAQVVNYARRRKFAEIRWVEPIDGRFLNDFRWSVLFGMIAHKSDAVGIETSGF